MLTNFGRDTSKVKAKAMKPPFELNEVLQIPTKCVCSTKMREITNLGLLELLSELESVFSSTP